MVLEILAIFLILYLLLPTLVLFYKNIELNETNEISSFTESAGKLFDVFFLYVDT